jgi:hypothetical protein
LRYIATLLSFVILMQFNLLVAPAYAEVISVTPSAGGSSGGISGQFAVTKVGALIAADALAILSGTEITIEDHAHHSHSSSNNNSNEPNQSSGPNSPNSPDNPSGSTGSSGGPGSPGSSGGDGPTGPSGTDNPGSTAGGKVIHKAQDKKAGHTGGEVTESLLRGSLIQISTAAHTITGCAIFTGGKNFSRINLRSCPDRVITKTGNTYTGKITLASDKALTIVCLDGSHNVNYSDIAEIHSGRAYMFSIPNYDSPSATMNLTPSCVHSVATHGSTLKKVIIVGLALTIVAVAVAVPVGIAASHHHHSNTNNLILANYFQSKQTVPMPIMPTGTSMPTAQQLGASYVATLINRPRIPTITTTTVRATAVSSTSTTVTTRGGGGSYFGFRNSLIP